MNLKILQILPGVIFTTICALLVIKIADIDLIKNSLHLSSLILAIVAGTVLRNSLKIPDILQSGITFSLKKILRLAIILLGFKISFNEINQVGFKGFIVIAISLISCLLFTYWFGKKIGINEKLAVLIASGTSICGASAIIASDSIIKAEEQDCSFAIAIVTIFGTISMFLYPLIDYFLHLKDINYALWTGSSIHEVAQVVAAGFSINENVGKLASVVKLTRVSFIVPVSILLFIWNLKQNSEQGKVSIKNITIPWFILGFLLVIMINSANIISKSLVNDIINFDNLLLTIAMVGMGLETSIMRIKAVGMKPIYVGLFSSVFISFVSFITTLLII